MKVNKKVILWTVFVIAVVGVGVYLFYKKGTSSSSSPTSSFASTKSSFDSCYSSSGSNDKRNRNLGGDGHDADRDESLRVIGLDEQRHPIKRRRREVSSQRDENGDGVVNVVVVDDDNDNDDVDEDDDDDDYDDEKYKGTVATTTAATTATTATTTTVAVTQENDKKEKKEPPHELIPSSYATISAGIGYRMESFPKYINFADSKIKKIKLFNFPKNFTILSFYLCNAQITDTTELVDFFRKHTLSQIQVSRSSTSLSPPPPPSSPSSLSSSSTKNDINSGIGVGDDKFYSIRIKDLLKGEYKAGKDDALKFVEVIRDKRRKMYRLRINKNNRTLNFSLFSLQQQQNDDDASAIDNKDKGKKDKSKKEDVKNNWPIRNISILTAHESFEIKVTKGK